MVFFSIVVPIHDVEQFLPECLDSILNQNFNDMEIIAVDDQSTDNSGAILDQYAARDTRISAIHLPENVGLGLARNAGLDAATGEYVLFLDSDDLFAPNALIETAQRLTRSDKPAVMAFNYSRMWPDGRVAHPSDSSVLHKLSGTTFVPRYEPAVFIPVGFAWNKAYKREFLTAHRIKFRAGFYEDISWTYEVLLKAQTAIARDWVVVLYRQRKSGSILASTSGKHFDVFAQYDAVFDLLDEQSVSPALRKLAYDKMINHFVAIWQHKGRLAKSDRKRFLRLASEYATKYRPEKEDDVKQNLPTNFRSSLLRSHWFALFRTYSWLDNKRTSSS